MIVDCVLSFIILLFSSGWPDPAVWRDHEGECEREDRVQLLQLGHHVRLGLRHEKVSNPLRVSLFSNTLDTLLRLLHVADV